MAVVDPVPASVSGERSAQLRLGVSAAVLSALLLLVTAALHWLAPSGVDHFGWRHFLALAAILAQVQLGVCFLLLGEELRSRQLEASGIGFFLAGWLVLLADLAVRPFMYFWLGLALGAVCCLGAMALLGLLDWGLPPLGKVAGGLLLLAFLACKVRATPPAAGIDLAVTSLLIGLAAVGLIGFPLWLGVTLLRMRYTLEGTSGPLGVAALMVAVAQAGLFAILVAAVIGAGPNTEEAIYTQALAAALPTLAAVTAAVQGAFAALTALFFRSQVHGERR